MHAAQRYRDSSKTDAWLPNIDTLEEEELTVTVAADGEDGDEGDGNPRVSFFPLNILGPIPPHFRSRKSSHG